MSEFDPHQHVENYKLLLSDNGELLPFCDAFVHSINIWHGDIRMEEGVCIGPEILVSLGLIEDVTGLPYTILRIKFRECDQVEMHGAGYGTPVIQDMKINVEERGFYKDGCTPLSPYLIVQFLFDNSVPLLSFRCMSIAVIARENPTGPPYA